MYSLSPDIAQARPTMVTGSNGPPTREANVLAAYKLLSEDASIFMNVYR